MASFNVTMKGFCDELLLTFPELEAQITRATSLTAAQFWRSWQTGLDVLLTRDSATLLSTRGGFLMGAVRLTPAVWAEISPATQGAIWKYLRTLTLEAALEIGVDGLETEIMQKLMAIMTAERIEKGGVEAEAETSELFDESMKHLSPLMERLKGLIGSSVGAGASGEGIGGLGGLGGLGGFMDLSGFTMPEIPERLRNGRIAKLAEDMAKQFDPKEFGIDPAALSGDNVEEILKRLAEMYQRDPTQLIAGAKKVAERIKRQILGGSLNRDELISEAQEFINIFKEHPQFKEMIGKATGLMGAGGLAEMFASAGGGTSEPSERRRAVQERLRKKLAARNAAASKK
jgi:hypothetical protein